MMRRIGHVAVAAFVALTFSATQLAAQQGPGRVIVKLLGYTHLVTLDSPRFQERILKDVEQGDRAKIQAVPTFFINGQQVHILLSMEDFVRVIEANLHK